MMIWIIPRNILSMAVPMTVAQLVNVLYSVVDRIYLGHLPGSNHLALTGIGVTMPIVSVIMGLANLCGTGGAPLCAMARGRGDNEEAERCMGNAFALLLLIGLSATALLMLVRRPMLLAFGASDDTFPYANDYLTIYLLGTLFVMVSLGMNPFRMYFCMFIFMALQMSSQSVVVSLGRARQAIFFSLFRKAIINAPLTILLPHFMGASGVFAAEAISQLVGGLASSITMVFTVYHPLGASRE